MKDDQLSPNYAFIKLQIAFCVWIYEYARSLISASVHQSKKFLQQTQLVEQQEIATYL